MTFLSLNNRIIMHSVREEMLVCVGFYFCCFISVIFLATNYELLNRLTSGFLHFAFDLQADTLRVI
jgi:hypothetical protein